MNRPSHFLSEAMWALPIGCVIALVWANTSPESYYPFSLSLSFFVNELAMALFLGVVMKEVVEATLPGGSLHPWRRAALPLAAAVGGTVVPIGVFLLFVRTVGDRMLAPAWVTICAADIAGVYVTGRLVIGRHAGLPFLLLLALGIDAIGLTAAALWNPVSDMHLVPGLALLALAVGAALAMRLSGVRRFWWYVIGPGAMAWCALYVAGLHPALALLPIVPFMPHASRDRGLFADPVPQAHDALTSFERWSQAPIDGVLLLFGLVNAGVPWHGFEEGTWAVPVALLIGRPIGVIVASRLAVAAGLHLPRNVRWPELSVMGCISSIGLVMALFFAATTMPTGPLLQELKGGALFTSAGALIALAAARALHVGRFAREP